MPCSRPHPSARSAHPARWIQPRRRVAPPDNAADASLSASNDQLRPDAKCELPRDRLQPRERPRKIPTLRLAVARAIAHYAELRERRPLSRRSKTNRCAFHRLRKPFERAASMYFLGAGIAARARRDRRDHSGPIGERTQHPIESCVGQNRIRIDRCRKSRFRQRNPAARRLDSLIHEHAAGGEYSLTDSQRLRVRERTAYSEIQNSARRSSRHRVRRRTRGIRLAHAA